jgi:hypothetical protein
MGSITNNLSNSYIQSLISGAPAGFPNQTTQTSPNGVNPQLLTTPPDNGQLSPFAQILSTLQQLEQSNPAQYQQVTQQIGANLQSAAQTAQASGNTTAANQLNQLATDFTNASKSGQLPNIQDLSQAVGGHHHHHHGGHGHSVSSAGGTDPASGTSGSSTGGSSTSGSLISGGLTNSTPTVSGNASPSAAQLFATLFANGAPDSATDPASIIFSTLSNAGLSNG